MERYNFNFIDQKILEIQFKATGLKPEKIEIKPNFEFHHEKEGKHLRVYLGISLDHKDAPFTFKITSAGLFDFKKNIDKEDIEDIANINCSAILYPFLREALADITRRAGFPPLLLPPINFVNMFQKMKVENTEKA